MNLSVVIPLYNEAPNLQATMDALVVAAERSPFTVEVVVVDDGSTDGSPAAARTALRDRLPLRVVERPHEGRFKARRAGVDAASHEWVLLHDARVRLHEDGLRFLHERLPNAHVWNGHVVVDAHGNAYGAFGDVVVHLAWARYFADPRETTFGLEDFDHYPKGTGCFVARRTLLLEAMDSFAPRIADWRFVSDDTQLIRWIAASERIHVAPQFGCVYTPRSNMRAFIKHALYRGSTFVDGHGRRESRFYPVVLGFFPVSAALAVAAVRRPSVVPVAAAATSAAAAVVAARARRPAFDIASFAALAPVYAVAHGAGMWRALGLVIRARTRR